MKSKEILPDTERLPEDYFKFFKKDDLLAKYHRALIAAEEQIGKTHYICPNSGEIFPRFHQGLISAYAISAVMRDEKSTVLNWYIGSVGLAFFHDPKEAIEWNKKKFNW